ncbi:MAG: hypothetical protein IJ197_06245 [Bacteroidaceae bacterium]|nr:hypothetical protein [Bacteroidaceae bacterium]
MVTENNLSQKLNQGDDSQMNALWERVTNLRNEASNQWKKEEKEPASLPPGLYDSLEHEADEAWIIVRKCVRHALELEHALARCCRAAAPIRSQEGLECAIRACASTVKRKADWWALLQVAQELGYQVQPTELCRLIAQVCPTAPQPVKQDLHGAWWNTHGRFPKWDPAGTKPDKYRRHTAVARAALPYLTGQA